MSRSTGILKGRFQSVDTTVEAWLSTTELADDADAVLRLSRAVDPHRYGFPKREPLDLSNCTPPEADMIVELLITGQVPTPEAVANAAVNPPNQNSDEMREYRRTEIKQIDAAVRADCDALGEIMSTVVVEHWAAFEAGPTWHEAWNSEPVQTWWMWGLGEAPDYQLGQKPTFTNLERRGWIATNQAPRSLCAGRRFHTRFFGDHVSHASAATIGYLVARHIGMHRRLHEDRSPSWAQIAADLTDAKGMPLFFNEIDGRAQQRWLTTQGWIRVERGELRRGDRAKAETRRRAALRRTATNRAA
ncbi:hypothetical protein [Nocardia tengchongensis]